MATKKKVQSKRTKKVETKNEKNVENKMKTFDITLIEKPKELKFFDITRIEKPKESKIYITISSFLFEGKKFNKGDEVVDLGIEAIETLVELELIK